VAARPSAIGGPGVRESEPDLTIRDQQLPLTGRRRAGPPACPACDSSHNSERRLVRKITVMICRLWRGWTTKDNADAYERIVRGKVIPGIEARGIPGFRSIDLLRRERDYDVEFMTLMWFDALDSVTAFTGEDYEVAHVPAEAQAVLADFDQRSAHYEVLDRRNQAG
jgi:heme-degrading monooxygenase HmoA